MRYLPKLFLRVLLCFVPFSVFYFIFLPLTVYGSFLLLFWYHPLVSGNVLSIKRHDFIFVESCVATAAYGLLWSLTLLVKDLSLSKRIKIIISAFILFLGMNVLRIAVLVFIALHYGSQWFDLVHVAMWKFVSGAYVALIWIFLVKIYKVDSIPIYDDIVYLYKESFFSRRDSGRQGDLPS